MRQDLDPSRAMQGREPVPDEIQQIWLSNELMERVRKVAHDIDERVSQALQSTHSPDQA